jgi:hypothetical protein
LQTGAPPEHADAVYSFRPLEELEAVVELVDEPYIGDAARALIG